MLSKRNDKSHEVSGFTLIEMLVVVIMIGVVAAIAAPAWTSFLSRQRMNTVRNDLIGVLRNAQDEAAARQQSRQVLLSPNLSVTVRNGAASTGGIVTVLGSGNTSKLSMTAASTSLVFDPNGRVDVATPFAITIARTDGPSSSSQSCVIVTTLLGGLKPANNDMCDTFNPSP